MEQDLLDKKDLFERFQTSQSQLALLTVSKQELENRYKVLESQYKEQIFQNEQDLNNAKLDFEYLTLQNQELKAKVFALEEGQKNFDYTTEEKLKNLMAQYERNLSIIASQESYITQVESQNISFADQIENLNLLNSKLERKKKKLNEDNGALRAKNKEFYENVEKISKEAEKIIAEQIKKEESRKNQQEEYMAVVKKYSILEKRNKDLQMNYEKLEKELVSKNERINSIRNSKVIIENKLKDEEKKNEELMKKIKNHENNVRYQRKIDSSESNQTQLEQELKLAESERKLITLSEKIEPLLKKNSQLEKLIEKYWINRQNIQINYLKNIQKELNSTITFLNLELSDYRKEGISIISPKSNVRKSQYLAFQNSSGIDKNFKMDPSRFSPLRDEESDFSEVSPMKNVPKPAKPERYLADTSEFHSNIILSPDLTADFRS